MGFEHIPMSSLGTFLAWSFVVYCLGCLTGSVLKTMWTRPEWEVRQEVLLEEKRERRKERESW